MHAGRRAAVVQFACRCADPARSPQLAELLKVWRSFERILARQPDRRDLAMNPLVDGAAVVDRLTGRRIRRHQIRLRSSAAGSPGDIWRSADARSGPEL